MPETRFSLGRPQPIPIPTAAGFPSSVPAFPRVAHSWLSSPSPGLPGPCLRGSLQPSGPGRSLHVPRRRIPAQCAPSSRVWRGRLGAAGAVSSPPGVHRGAVFAFVSLLEERVHGGSRGARAVRQLGSRRREGPARTQGRQRAQVSEWRLRSPTAARLRHPVTTRGGRGAGRPPATGSLGAPGKVVLTFPEEGPPDGRCFQARSARALGPAGGSGVPGLGRGWGYGVLSGHPVPSPGTPMAGHRAGSHRPLFLALSAPPSPPGPGTSPG